MRRIRSRVMAGLWLAACGWLVIAAAPTSASADDHHNHPPAHPPSGYAQGGGGAHHVSQTYTFHHHDYAHFNAHERRWWTGGRWNSTCYNGLCGWWWLAGGAWYYYAQPVYPYPYVVSRQVYVTPAMVGPAPVVVLPPPAPPPLPVPAHASSQVRYYCDNPAGYYPYVEVCNGDFRTVPGGGK